MRREIIGDCTLYLGDCLKVLPTLGAVGVTEYLHVPRDGFLLYLADGWQLPFIVELSIRHHGRYSVTLQRAVWTDPVSIDTMQGTLTKGC